MTPLDLALARACAATYDSSVHPEWQDKERLVHVYLSEVDGKPCIAWEGTHNIKEWIIDFIAVEIPIFEHTSAGLLHAGFARDVLTVLGQITAYLEGLGWPPYYNAGHSKGGGECTIFHAFMKEIGHPPLATRAYEPPRVGSDVLRRYVAEDDYASTATRNTHGRDFVTMVPFGPSWIDTRDHVALIVPDDLDLADKHRIPAVLAAIESAIGVTT